MTSHSPDDFNPHDERNTQQCRKCDEVKSVAEFPWSKLGSCYERRCYDCKRRMYREWYKPRPREDTWKPQEIAKLRECIDADMTMREAAKTIGRSYYGTAGQRIRQGLPPFRRRKRPPSPRGKWPVERVAQLKQLRDRDLPFSICAAILGTTRNAAIGAAYKYLKQDCPRVQESRPHEITLPDLRAANRPAAAAALLGSQHSHAVRPCRQAAPAAGGDSSCPAETATAHGFVR